MLYRDIEKKLDMQITLSIMQDHPVIPMLAREVDSVPLDSYRSGNEAFIDLFIGGEPEKHLEGTLSAFEPKRIGEFMVVRIASREMATALDLNDEIATIPSTVRGGFYLKGNKIFAEYRFHSSDLAAMTRIGRKITQMKNDIRIHDFGPSRGGIALMESIAARTPLGVVSFEADILKQMGLSTESDYFIEYNNHILESSGLKAIIYNGIEADFSIPGESPAGRVNVTRLTNPMLIEIWKSAASRRVPRASVMAKPVQGKYRALIFVPYSMMNEHLSILYDAAEKYPEAGMELVAAREYGQDVWE